MAAGATTIRSSVAVALLAAGGAAASPRAALIGGGDCRDPELLSHLVALSGSLEKGMADRLVDDDVVREKLRPQPQRGADELRRQLDAARMQYYQADFKRAEGTIALVRDDARKLPPGPDRFRLWADGEVLLALLYRDTQRNDDADEAFRRVLRVQPDFQLDADLFSPTTRQRFDRLRREVTNGKRARLEVRTSPAGAEVFAEGLKLGKTPFLEELPAGTYALGVVKGELAALPRQIVLAGPMQLHIDLGFEGSIQPTRVTCLADAGDEGIRLSNAVKLATLLDVEEIVVLRLDRPTSGPAWLAASLVNVQTGQKVREGGLKLIAKNTPPEALDELATFVITGERTTRVETPPAALVPVASDMSPASAPNAVAPQTVEVQTPRSWKRPASYAAGGVGALALGAGVYFLTQSAAARSEFDSYRLGNGAIDPDRRFEAAAARNRADFAQTVSLLSFGVGAAAVGAGAWLFITSGPSPRLAIVPTGGGASVSFALRF